MSNNLISRIAESSKIWTSDAMLCTRTFSLSLAIEIDGIIHSLIIESSFLGVDEIIWGNIYKNTATLFKKEDGLDIESTSITVSRTFVSYVEPNIFLSIREIIFTAKCGSVLKIFSDIDEFEVPCVNSLLLLP